MKKNDEKILVIEFHDNDFGTALKIMGRHLLEIVGYEGTKRMVEADNKTQLFSRLLSICAALANGFSWHIKHESIVNLKTLIDDVNNNYLNSDYFEIKSDKIYFNDNFCNEWDNGETLIVDFYNNNVYLV